jgi:hypothetical protein
LVDEDVHCRIVALRGLEIIGKTPGGFYREDRAGRTAAVD